MLNAVVEKASNDLYILCRAPRQAHPTTCRDECNYFRTTWKDWSPAIRFWGLSEVHQQKQGCTFHRRPYIGQISFIQRKQVLFPQMMGKPCAGDLINVPKTAAPFRRGIAPDISIDTSYPTPGPIDVFSSLCPVNGKIFNQIDQWQMTFGQIGQVNRPIVDLNIAIQSIVGTPRRTQVFVPDALKCGCFCSRPGRGYEQVPSKLKVERCQVGVLSCRIIFNSFRIGLSAALSVPKSISIRPKIYIIVDVCLFQLIESLLTALSISPSKAPCNLSLQYKDFCRNRYSWSVSPTR